MRVAVYARVSTDEQESGNQLPALEQLAGNRGWEIVEVYKEEATAWKFGHQRELARVVDDARLGKFQAVLVWALDRLTREGVASILSLYNKFGQYKCQVISYQEPWTETAPGPMTELLLAVAGWVARMESERRSERTKAGMERARKAGKHVGRPKGSKDTVRRKRSKYFARYEDK